MSYIKDSQRGRHIRKIAQVTSGALVGPDGSPVKAISVYSSPPADGRGMEAVSFLINEGEATRYVDMWANGVLQTPDGRPVCAVQLFNAAGIELPYGGGGAGGLTLDFINSEYWAGGIRRASLAAMPGYAFTDSIDNLPNINASGFTPVTAEASRLLLNARPDGSAIPDGDFMFWATVVPPVASTGVQRWLMELCDGTNNNRATVILDTTGLAVGQVITAGVVNLNVGAGAFASDATAITVLMRRLAGVWQIGAVKAGALTWSVTDVNFPTGMTQCRIGTWVNGGGNQTDAPIRQCYFRSATYDTDAKVLAAITASL